MTDENSETDRRRAPRVRISVSFSETDPRTATPVSDVSEVGAFVVTEQLHPIGSTIELSFVVLPEEPTLFRAFARVVRHSRDPQGMGVEFQGLDDAMRDLVRRLLDSERARRQRTSRRGRRRTLKL